MARFNPTPDPTNDPSYIYASKEPDKVKGYSALGDLFQGLGTVGSGLVKATDDTIKASLKKDVYDMVDPIRNRHGADVTPNEAPTIAGTGARGAKWEAAGSGEDLGMSEAEMPVGMKNSMDGLRRNYTRYAAGEMSDTHYSAELLAGTKGLYAKYPGYREEVDAFVKEVSGQNAANTLRSSVLRDMNSMMAAAGAADKRFDTWYEKHQDQIWAFYGQGKDWAKSNQNLIENDPKFGAWRGQKALQEYGEIGRKISEQDARTSAPLEINLNNKALFHSILTKAGISADQILANIRSGKYANDPKAAEEITAALTQLEIAAESQAREIMDRARGSEKRSYASFLKPDEKNQYISSAGDMARDFKKAIAAKDWNAMTSIIHANQQFDAVQDRALNSIVDFSVAASVRRRLGDTAAGLFAQSTKMFDNFNGALVERLGVGIANTGGPKPMTLSEFYKTVSKTTPNGKVPGELVLGGPEMVHGLVMGKDKETSERAVHTIFSNSEWFAKLNDNQKMAFFEKYASADTTKRIAQLSPEAQGHYRDFTDRAFKSVFKRGADDLQSIMQDNRADWNFDPQTMKFSATPLPNKNNPLQREFAAQLQGRVEEINRGMGVYAPVLKQMFPGKELDHMVGLLGDMGVNFNSEKSPSILNQLGKKIYDMFQTKSSEDINIDTKNIPDGMSPKEYLKQLKKDKRSEGASVVTPASDPGMDPQHDRGEVSQEERMFRGERLKLAARDEFYKEVFDHIATLPIEEQRASGIAALKKKMLDHLGVDVRQDSIDNTFDDRQTVQQRRRRENDDEKATARRLKAREKQFENNMASTSRESAEAQETNGAWMKKNHKKELDI